MWFAQERYLPSPDEERGATDEHERRPSQQREDRSNDEDGHRAKEARVLRESLECLALAAVGGSPEERGDEQEKAKAVQGGLETCQARQPQAKAEHG